MLDRCPHTSDGRLPRDEMSACEFCEGTAYCLGEIDQCPPDLEPDPPEDCDNCIPGSDGDCATCPHGTEDDDSTRRSQP